MDKSSVSAGVAGPVEESDPDEASAEKVWGGEEKEAALTSGTASVPIPVGCTGVVPEAEGDPVLAGVGETVGVDVRLCEGDRSGDSPSVMIENEGVFELEKEA